MPSLRRPFATLAALALLLSLGACSGSTGVATPSDTATSGAQAEGEHTNRAVQDDGSADESPQPSEEATDEARQEATPEPTATATAEPEPAQGTALAVLDTLEVKGRAPKTGYSRDQFGAAWADVDHNGCDTRNDILNRDLTETTHKANTHDCVVATGVLDDPYTATRIDFVRGQDTSTAVQIDHVVALSDAWQKGAQQLSEETRRQLANDPYNLLAVDGPANQQKSDGDAATWLPANTAFRCEYVARQIGVKAKYHLWVTQAEHDAMANVLASCPTQQVPADGGVIGPVDTTAAQAQETAPQDGAAAAEPEPAAQPTQEAAQEDANVTYRNCAAVRAAGKAPLYRGEPGYAAKLDRDGDGIACE